MLFTFGRNNFLQNFLGTLKEETMTTGARIYDIEDGNNAREKAIAKGEITWMMNFVNPTDEGQYLISLKNLFYFPTFWPIIILFVGFTSGTNGILNQVIHGDGFLITSFLLEVIDLVLILIFTIAQFVDFFRDYMSDCVVRVSRYLPYIQYLFLLLC